MKLKHNPGFTLIELMIAMTIMGFLILLALPSFSRWIANTKVRTMAESLQNGLRLTQLEAAKRNSTVTLSLTNDDSPDCTSTAASSGKNWIICAETNAIQTGIGKAGSENVNVNSGFSSISFDGLGRTNLAAAATIALSSSAGSCETSSTEGIRCLSVLISPAGKVRLCDPRLSSPDPAACS